ncbi:MAG: hypothetical protein V4598_00645 [Bdellovibrionota bacterium]
MGETAKNLDSGEQEAKRFRTLALRYQEIGAIYGIIIHPFRSPDMPYFERATSAQRKKATDFLESIVDIHEETLAAKVAAINTKQLIWRALRRLSLVPGPQAFDSIADNDVVVIYGENQSAIFWNLQFFQFSSLSVEEMFFGVWHNFTKRDPAIHKKLYEMALDIISGKITGTFTPDVPPHEVQEIDSLECIKTMMGLPSISVLTSMGHFAGMLIVQRMKIIE